MTRHPGTLVAGVLFVIVGIAFLGESLDWWTVAVRRLWPVFLIAIGAVVILNAAQDRGENP